MAADSNSNLWIFLVKILGLSVGISVMIKYLGPQLPVPATSGVALALVLAPTLIMGILLAVRSKS